MERSALESISEAVLAIAAEREVDPVLRRLVAVARELAGARYAALGIPDGQGAFAQFITEGMSDELIAAMGPLPRTHGLLGAMLESPDSYRTPDIRQDPRFRGWWPRAHPTMRSFLGVPIVARGDVIAAFYLTDCEGADDFSDEDQRLIEMLAAHAAVAIENARLLERSRELNIVEERNRLARELHDAVSQKLFGLVLNAEAASTLLARDPDAAARAGRAARRAGPGGARGAARADLRAAPRFARRGGPGGDAAQAGRHARARARARRSSCGSPARRRPPAEADGEVLRIAQEALNNALRHADAERIELRLQGRDGRLTLTVADDGVGFDPDAPGRALAPARADVDGGARPRARRHARGRLPARRRHDGHARGAAVIRVLIADDHAVVRQGLRTFLDLQDDIEVVAEASRRRRGAGGGGAAGRPTSC